MSDILHNNNNNSNQRVSSPAPSDSQLVVTHHPPHSLHPLSFACASLTYLPVTVTNPKFDITSSFKSSVPCPSYLRWS